MNSLQSRHKHLTELKKLSQQLKNSTENTTTLDFNLIKSILYTTQSISRNNSQQTITSNQFNQPKGSRFLGKDKSKTKSKPQQNQKITKQSTNKNFVVPVFRLSAKVEQDSKKEFQISNINYDDKNSRIEDSKMKTSQQNDELMLQKNYSADLQKKLVEMEEQLQKSKQSLQELKHDRSVPFFKLSQKLRAFATKIPISQEDYDKLQFTNYFTELDINSIFVHNQTNQSQKSYRLEQLVNVDYASQELLILRFEKLDEKTDKKMVQTLYLQFKDNQDYRKWDLAIYMNKKLGICLQKQTKLFQFQPQLNKKVAKQYSPVLKKSSTSQLSPRRDNIFNQSFDNASYLSANDQNFKNVEDKQLLKAYIQAKQKQLQLRRMLNAQLMSKIYEKKQRQSDRNSPEKGDSKGMASKNFFVSENSSFQKMQQRVQENNKSSRKPIQKLAGLSNLKSLQNSAEKRQQNNYGQALERLNTVKEDNDEDERSANDEALQSYTSKVNNMKQEQYSGTKNKVSQEKTLFLEDQNAEKSKRIQQAVLKLAIELQQKKQKENKLQRAFVHLKSGYEFIKYAAGGWQPHKKRVCLSNDGKQIHFFDIKNLKDIKKYKIIDLQKIEYPKIGKGIQKHVPNAKFDMSKYAILTFGDKVIELGAQIPQNILDFITQLHLVRQGYKVDEN